MKSLLVISCVAMMIAGCMNGVEPNCDNHEPDVITIVEHIWHETTEHIWHTTIEHIWHETTVIEEDSTPDVIDQWHFEYPSGPVPCMVLMEGGMPAMADQPLSGLTAANTINDDDLLLITQAGTSKKISFNDFPMPTNYIGGLITSYNATDPDADVDIAPGSCRDDGDAANLRLISSLTKQLDAAWAVGTNQGGLDTGSIAPTTLYAIWLIKRSDTGVVDALFSTSFTSPTMPTDYDLKRLIGAVKTDATSDIIRFFQSGDDFVYLGDATTVPPEDVNDNTITDLTWEQGTLSVPPWCMAHIAAELANATSTVNNDGKLWIRARPPTSWGPGGRPYWQEQEVNATFDLMTTNGYVLVDGNSQIDYAAREQTGSASVVIHTLGFRMCTRREPQ